MGYLGGFLVTIRQHGRKNRVTTQYSGGRLFKRDKRNAATMDEKSTSPSVCTDAMCSIATKMAWKNALVANCVQQYAQPTAFMCVAR
jgi:hypothetical protein